jgi:hypothetical protein
MRSLLLALLASALPRRALGVVVSNLRTEYLENPLGLDKLQPRFQWELEGGQRGLVQVSYRIRVGTASADGSVWDSKDVDSAQNYQIKYGGAALASGGLYHWSVSVATKTAGEASAAAPATSAPAFFSMGMLTKAAWGAGSFIGMPAAAAVATSMQKPPAPPPPAACPWFRKSFTLPAGDLSAVGAALVSVASVGYHELFVNGQPASEGVLLPSVSYLPKRVLYRTYDVSALLKPGAKNAIGIWAAAGWGTYKDLDHGISERAPLLLVKLQAGLSFELVSDATWKVRASNIVSTGGGPGGGDSLDDSQALPNWNAATLDDSGWVLAEEHPLKSFPTVAISADAMEPTVKHSSVLAASVTMVYDAVTGSAGDGGAMAELPQSEWWGASSLRPEPISAAPAFCGVAGLDPGTTTHYEKLSLACSSHPGDSIASVSFAVWGVPAGGPSCDSWKAGDKCGSVNETISWVEQSCVGKASCTLDAIKRKSPTWDPCRDKKKQLVVVASCKLGSGKATAVQTGPPPKPPAPPGPPPPLCPPLCPRGVWLVTMNELYTGWFEVRNMKGPPNSTVHFQVSTTAGKTVEFGMRDSYTFGPSGSGDFRMRFAYHEIYYITITGLETMPSPQDVIGYRLTSLGKRTGDFACSSELISQIYNTTVNNYRGLTTGGMTVDCPHRERRGYGGDGHTSYQFALANYPVGAFFNKWTRDFADVQGVSGGFGTPAGTGLVPNTAPTVGGGGGPAWSGFVVTNPWQTFNTFGDTDILRDMYPTMVKLLDFYTNATHPSDGLLHPWDSSMWDFLGDWITPHGSEGKVNSPQNLLFNNCYLRYITKLVGKISSVLGNTAAAAKYEADATRIGAAVMKAYGNASTGVFLDTLQTHAVMPLASGLVPASVANKTWANLAEQITVTNSGHLDTGLTGTYFMTKVLMESGRNDLVFLYANQTTFPSYGYFLQKGYTTWPEQWDVKSGDSLMHGCFNGIGLWFVEGVAGIRVHASESPPLTIKAGVDAGDISWASGERKALHGTASSAWQLSGSQFRQQITIPPSGVAKVLIPSKSGAAGVTEGGKPVASAVGVKVIGVEMVNKISYVVLEVASGTFSFVSDWSRTENAVRL